MKRFGEPMVTNDAFEYLGFPFWKYRQQNVCSCCGSPTTKCGFLANSYTLHFVVIRPCRNYTSLYNVEKKPAPSTKPKCTCDVRMITTSGCKCGGA